MLGELEEKVSIPNGKGKEDVLLRLIEEMNSINSQWER